MTKPTKNKDTAIGCLILLVIILILVAFCGEEQERSEQKPEVQPAKEQPVTETEDAKTDPSAFSEKEACRMVAEVPEFFELFMNDSLNKGMDDSDLKCEGGLKIIAATPPKAPGQNTEVFVICRLTNSPSIYMYQLMDGKCQMVSQKFYFDADKVDQEIRQRKLLRLQ